jgi:hypothetical protein
LHQTQISYSHNRRLTDVDAVSNDQAARINFAYPSYQRLYNSHNADLIAKA